jgi:RNA polymerase sigma-70 factor (ECF subfamily)
MGWIRAVQPTAHSSVRGCLTGIRHARVPGFFCRRAAVPGHWRLVLPAGVIRGVPRSSREAFFLAHARAGDPAAFEHLVIAHRDRVYRTAVRIIGIRADADDITQEVFLEAWRDLPAFRGESELSTWLYRITVRRCLRHLKRRARERVGLAPGEVDAADIRSDVVGHPATGDVDVADPAGVVEAVERRRLLMTAIDRLEPAQRVALVLHQFEDLTYEQTAAALGTTVNAVRGRIYRARRELAKALRGQL